MADGLLLDGFGVQNEGPEIADPSAVSLFERSPRAEIHHSTYLEVGSLEKKKELSDPCRHAQDPAHQKEAGKEADGELSDRFWGPNPGPKIADPYSVWRFGESLCERRC